MLIQILNFIQKTTNDYNYIINNDSYKDTNDEINNTLMKLIGVMNNLNWAS